MSQKTVLLSIAALHQEDLARMPQLRQLADGGTIRPLIPSFPCVTCPVQANVTTGTRPREHGVVGNGFYWRQQRQVEMWTAPNQCIERPQLWEVVKRHRPELTSAVWFPLHSKQCQADYVCTPAPIHHPDGSESLWCYTQPGALYGELRQRLGDFPLQHFWGPLANIRSTAWIVDSALYAAGKWKPDLFYIYLPHLDYAAQRSGPQSPPHQQALAELDEQVGRLAQGFAAAYDGLPRWIVAGEYAITPVDHVTYPNRVLREAGLLSVHQEEDGEQLDLTSSRAWALVDHQFAHVFLADAALTSKVAQIFQGQRGFAEVLCGDAKAKYALDHPRSGEVVLISTPDSWQAYYWWWEDQRAPAFARRVDIHRKPGYDPVELHFDPSTKTIPLDATLVRGSHGAPANDPAQQSVVLTSFPWDSPAERPVDVDLFALVLQQFGLGCDHADCCGGR